VSTVHAGFTISVAEVKLDKVKVPAGNVISAGAGWQVIENALEKALPILCPAGARSLRRPVDRA
jgi:alkylation response protein AidB-like acyl-CoA dehydrogenase